MKKRAASFDYAGHSSYDESEEMYPGDCLAKTKEQEKEEKKLEQLNDYFKEYDKNRDLYGD